MNHKEKVEILEKIYGKNDDPRWWAKELKHFNKLIERYPEPEFWNTFRPSYGNSLYPFLVGAGKKYIDFTYSEFQTHFKLKQAGEKPVKLTDKKVGKDKNTMKVKSLKDFLRER